MGLSFTGDGRYVGWSSLFDLSTLETLKASEKLPQPKQRYYYNENTQIEDRKFTLIEQGSETLDITNEVEALFKIETSIEKLQKELNDKETKFKRKKEIKEEINKIKVDRIEAYNSLIRKLNTIENPSTYKTKNGDIVKTFSIKYNPEHHIVVKNIINHEQSTIPFSLLEACNKNFVSSHIQGVVQHLRNMIAAYSPIQMEDLRETAKDSPKGDQASLLTLFNPAAKFIMQYLNMVGKNVIGIAANGEKVSFMWHYWVNDTLQKATSVDDLKYIDFEVTLKRIVGRASGTLKEVTIKSLPEIDIEKIKNVSTEALQIIKGERKSGRLKNDITVDLMISLILSAATDNAKELILDKINCGSELAKMYLYLVTIGCDIKDIVKFMTSPVVNFVDSMLNLNIFTNTSINMYQALNFAKGDFKKLRENNFKSINNYIYYTLNLINSGTNPFIDKKIQGGLYEIALNLIKTKTKIQGQIETDLYSKIALAINLGQIEELKDYWINETKFNKVRIEFNNYVNLVKSIKSAMKFDPNNEGIKQDMEEFKYVFDLAEEFSNAAKLLGINQGIKTSKIDLNLFILNMQDAYTSRIEDHIEELEEDLRDLDVYKFLNDSKYKQRIIDTYDKYKGSINIFAMIDLIPHYKAMYDLLGAVLEIDKNTSLKTRMFDKAHNILKTQYNLKYIPKDYLKKLLGAINTTIIREFILTECDIKIPYMKGLSKLNNIGLKKEIEEDGIFNFKSTSELQSFKEYFENTLIPALKKGYVYDYDENGKVIEKEVPGLANNSFINSLLRITEGDMPLYRCALDMSNAENNEYSKRQLFDYVSSLLKLSNIKINGTYLSDIFMLYNLIVNLNLYGSNKLTALFESFVTNDELKLNNLLFKYLNWLGEMDYKQRDIPFNIIDLMILSSRTTNTLIGAKDPSVIIRNEDGSLEFYIKENFKYSKKNINFLTPVSNLTNAQNAERLRNNSWYNSLGGSVNSYIENIVETLKNIKLNTKNALEIINTLYRRGLLTITTHCD